MFAWVAGFMLLLGLGLDHKSVQENLLSCSLVHDFYQTLAIESIPYSTISNIIHLLCSFNWIMHNIKGILNTEQNKKKKYV